MKKPSSTDHEYVSYDYRPKKRGIISPFKAFVSVRHTMNRQLQKKQPVSTDDYSSALCKPADPTTCTLFIADENSSTLNSIAGLARSIIFFNWKNHA